MDFLRSARVVSEAAGSGVVDWDRAAAAAKESTDPGSIALTSAEREGYATDVRDANARLREVAGIDFDVPASIEVQNRHHWIDASAGTFRRVMAPIEATASGVPWSPVRDLSRIANTGSMAFALGFLARNVLGQYDPLLLADEPDADHGLYFVHPNIVRVASMLDVETPRFRRWIAFHEVTHAAEFGAAPWLPEYLESRVERGVDGLSSGGFDPAAFAELQTAMTAVEGYAELLMDRAFDGEYADLRRKLDARRGGGGPVQRLARRLLGLGLKRRQYERGAAFFSHVADARGIEAASVVWDSPDFLPTDDEIENPAAWITRVDP
ncbi:zinc-dependent metalloprotease [Halorubrum laminariae]|uniref:Zinc-dependent metalloprotease n=1 Tax=Halorubrum laminariae TaxID=1433523 RepID=A0ABD6BWG8_9EURY|nr:zinc-dependent metalloprotease [Halorubrum laminariae]